MKAAIICFVAILCLMPAGAAFPQDKVQMTVEPRVIDIGAFFDGTALTAAGEVPENGEAVLRFLGASCDLHLKERGKLFGIMWMNLDSLTVSGVPSVCIVNSAAGLDALGKGESGEGRAGSLGLSGIAKEARIETSGSSRGAIFAELLKLKESEGLYRELAGNVTYGPVSGGVKSFQAQIPVPARLAPGDYVVDLTLIKDGKIAAHAEQPVTVKLIGFPLLLSNLAFGHAALYGILSTLIAIAAGLAIGLAFQSKGAH